MTYLHYRNESQNFSSNYPLQSYFNLSKTEMALYALGYYHISNINFLAKTVNGSEPLTVLPKSFILDV